MKFLSVLFSLLASVASQAQPIDSADFPKGFDLKTAIQGEYKNSRGDQAVVEVTAEEQQDLFQPVEYFVKFTLESKGEVQIVMDEDNFDQISEDGAVTFIGKQECDDPGCTSGEFEFTFKKKKDGSYYLAGSINYSSEENENVEAWWTGDIADLSQDDVAKYCQETYGPESEGYYDSSYAYCEYTHSYQLKKLK